MARFVLVHGAFHGAWCWDPLVAELEAKGHEVIAVDLPGHGDDPTPDEDVTLAGASAALCAVLRNGRPAILVSHSMGGVVCTQAASDCPEHVERLVYVTAYIPTSGERLADLAKFPENEGDQVVPNMIVERPVATFPPEKAADVFYPLCTDEQAQAAAARLCPSPLSLFGTPLSLNGVQPPPAAFVTCEQDRAVPIALQRMMLERRGCTDVLELDTDHSPFMSKTAELAAFLDSLA